MNPSWREEEFRRAWLVVVYSFFCHFIVGGTFFSFAMFYIEFVYQFGTSTSEAGWIGSLFACCFQLSGIVSSVFVQRYGCRPVTMAGGIAAGIGFITSSFVTSVPVLYLTYGILTGTGIGMIWLPSLIIVQQYFTRPGASRRSLAAALSACGFSFGAIVVVPCQRYMIEALGWRGTVLIFGGLQLNACAMGMLYRPVGPEKKSRDATVGELHDQLQDHEVICDTDIKISLNNVQELQLERGNRSCELHADEAICLKDHTADDVTCLKDHTADDVTCLQNRTDNDVTCANAHTKKKSSNISSNASCLMDESSGKLRYSICSQVLAISKEVFDFSLLKRRYFALFCIATYCLDTGIIAYSQHNLSRAVHYGISMQQASLIPLVTGISEAVARITSGAIGNLSNSNRPLQYGILVLLGGVVEILFVFTTTFQIFMVFSVLFGFCIGGLLGIQQTVVVDMFGISNLGRAQAIMSLFVAVAVLITTPFAGYLYDVTRNYNIPYYATGSIQLIGGIILCILVIHRQKSLTGKKQIL